MKNNNNVKKILAGSLVISSLGSGVVYSVPAGAYFTSSQTTSINQILAATLDVQLLNAAGTAQLDNLTFTDGQGTEQINKLFEPGRLMETEAFTLKNAGNVSAVARFKMSNIVGDRDLLDKIHFSLLKDCRPADADNAVWKQVVDFATMEADFKSSDSYTGDNKTAYDAFTADSEKIAWLIDNYTPANYVLDANAKFDPDGSFANFNPDSAGPIDSFTLAADTPEANIGTYKLQAILPADAGNSYQGKSCSFDVIVLGYQGTVENAVGDTNRTSPNRYDYEAWKVSAGTAAELVAAAAHGSQTITLSSDITLTEDLVLADHTTLNLNGHNIITQTGESNSTSTAKIVKITGDGVTLTNITTDSYTDSYIGAVGAAYGDTSHAVTSYGDYPVLVTGNNAKISGVKVNGGIELGDETTDNLKLSLSNTTVYATDEYCLKLNGDNNTVTANGSTTLKKTNWDNDEKEAFIYLNSGSYDSRIFGLSSDNSFDQGGYTGNTQEFYVYNTNTNPNP